MIDLERRGSVFLLRMDAGENRIDAALLDALVGALDAVESSEGPAALVTTGSGRFYCNGLDLEWLAKGGADSSPHFVERLQRALGRLLTLPVVSVAAVNGHAFAGGAMLALAHDYRVMRADRGYFCINEVDLATGQPITLGMRELIACRLVPRTLHEMILTGRRYPGLEAAEQGIVHEARPEAEVLPRALEIAEGLAGKHRATVAALKRRLFDEVVRALDQPLDFGRLPASAVPRSLGE